jgi:hypothetical protein
VFEYKPYTGVGSRETPVPILGIMSVVAYYLAKAGYTLRSGAAPGADTAFETGAWAAVDSDGTAKPEIYLPWRDFENRSSPFRAEPQDEAFTLAAQFHPSWDKLTQGGRALHARNVHQVLGFNVNAPDISGFLICWTRDGKGGGGTGQALRIARHYGVREVYDLANREHLEIVKEFIPKHVPAPDM